MPIQNPTQLVDEFKKSGEFDKLRRELLAQFRSGAGLPSFMTRVEEIAKQKLSGDQKLQYLPEATITREVMQELDRYPIVERAVGEVDAFSDPAFATSIRQRITALLQNDKNPILPRPQTTQSPHNQRDNLNSQSDRLAQPPAPTDHLPASPSPNLQLPPRPNGREATQPEIPPVEPLDSAVATQEPVQASVPIVIGDARGRSVHFDDSSHIEPTEKQPEDPGSPDSAMVESPLTEERPLDREAP